MSCAISSPLSSRSAAATFASSCSTLLAPGIATTFGMADHPRERDLRGRRVVRLATARNASMSSCARDDVLGQEQRIEQRAPRSVGQVRRVVARPTAAPCASGLYAITTGRSSAAYGTSSASGLRTARLYCTWFDSTGAPSAVSGGLATASSEKLLTPTWLDDARVDAGGACPPSARRSGTTGFGQWIWYRSIMSTPSRSALLRPCFSTCEAVGVTGNTLSRGTRRRGGRDRAADDASRTRRARRPRRCRRG